MKKYLSNFLIMVFITGVVSHTIYAEGIIKYVTVAGAGSKNGSSWQNAYDGTQLQTAIDFGLPKVWVAKGTYTPGIERNISFQMKNNVAIYGGFNGTEDFFTFNLADRDFVTNETILSGDIGDIGVNTDNSEHIIYNVQTDPLMDNSAVLDGFTVRDGFIEGYSFGGGMYNEASSPKISNCRFISNYAEVGGGGMYNGYGTDPVTESSIPSSPTITNCTFTSNSSANYGGGMYNVYSSPTLINCIFSSNYATAENGGGMSNYGSSSSPTLTNCTFSSNTSNTGGGIGNTDASSLTLNNCIVWGNSASGRGNELYLGSGTTTMNYSCYAVGASNVYNGGTFTETNNTNSDPQFVGSSLNPAHPYALLGTSPCVDIGNDSYNVETNDIRGTGYSRKLDKTTGATGRIDMGAYEYQFSADPLPVELTSFSALVKGKNIELAWRTETEFNNHGFEIERRASGGLHLEDGAHLTWNKIGFVEGHGTTNAPQSYSFVDPSATGTVLYRLKQIDRDGKFEYSNQVEVSVAAPQEFALMQNHPNPFNPSTSISYSLPAAGHVSLKVYDMLGKEVAVLVNGVQDAGAKIAQFNASQLPSGIYFYTLQANNFTATKKMLLVK